MTKNLPTRGKSLNRTPLGVNTVKNQETATTLHRDVTVAHYNLVMLDRELTQALGGRRQLCDSSFGGMKSF